MQDKYKINKIIKHNKYIEVFWSDNHISKYHFLWLRDNCPSAFHKDTRMRNFNILSVSNYIHPLKINYSNEILNLKWSEKNQDRQARNSNRYDY